MKPLVFPLLFFTLFAASFIHANEAEKWKNHLVGYVKACMAKETDEELNAKELPELIDMAIAALKKRQTEETETQQEILQKHIDSFEDLKANLAERIKDIIRPITDPNHVSKVHHAVSEEDFDNAMKSAGDKLIIVDFYATWCVPCESIGLYLSAFADKYESQVSIIKVDVDEQYDLTIRFGIQSLPTIMYFKNGQKVEEYRDASWERMEATIERLTN